MPWWSRVMVTSIPSPTEGVWHLGPLPLRAYAFCILVGIVVAVLVAERRWRARGGEPGIALDVATYAVPLGVVGGRLYHVITTPEPYFGKGGSPIHALYVWQGGLGIWGSIALGAFGGWLACRRRGVSFVMFADCAAPGIALAQACGRWGNYFNNELYGRRTSLPWGLEVHQWDESAGHAVRDSAGHPIVLGTFQPTFLYESLWCVGVAVAVVLLERRFRLDRGRTFAAYVMLYTAGRAWIEYLRVDEAHHLLGLRLNDWVALVVFLAALAYFVTVSRRPREPESQMADVPSSTRDASSP
jgi:phosphatidylglycerol---prolipoprotein diacylglyceryl transferase